MTNIASVAFSTLTSAENLILHLQDVLLHGKGWLT
jgi:hypothetical protein